MRAERVFFLRSPACALRIEVGYIHVLSLVSLSLPLVTELSNTGTCSACSSADRLWRCLRGLEDVYASLAQRAGKDHALEGLRGAFGGSAVLYLASAC